MTDPLANPVTDKRRNSFCGTLLAALTFFTRMPRPRWPRYHAADDIHAAAFAPWIGWLVAIVAVIVLDTFSRIVPIPVAVTLMLIATAWFTGAIHEDGFADYCDGFGTQRNATETLAIMRDSRTGAFGVLGLVLLFLLKYSLLTSLVEGLPFAAAAGAIAVTHIISRFVAISFMYTQDYVRINDADAKAAPLSSRMPGHWFAFALLGTVIPVFAAAAWIATSLLWIVPALVCVRIWFALSFQRRLSGYTGDCLGAVQQVSEVVALLVITSAWLI